MHLRAMPIALALAIGLSVLSPRAGSAGEGAAGSYLAGRIALSHFDYAEAATAFTRALIASPRDPQFLESAVLSRVATNEIDLALPMVRQLDSIGASSQAAAMVTFATLARDENYDGIISELDRGRSSGKLVDGLARAWALVGKGRMSEATTAFDDLGKLEGLKPFAAYHKALALASVGDFEGADAILRSGDADPLGTARRGLIARAQIMSQLERQTEAAALLGEAFGTDPDPQIARILDDLRAGKAIPFTIVTGPRDGLAEVLFNVAAAMMGDKPDPYTLGYARLAALVRPGHIEAVMLAAGILEAQGQYVLAGDAYNAVPREDPAYHAAELGRAAVLIKAGRTDAAIETLVQLTKTFPDMPRVWISLGDTLRREERYAEAARAYDTAITQFTQAEPSQWPVYYARGIANERLGNWSQAEADFRKALEFSPDQPQVLNYLGYSYVEKGQNLEEALSMIERAEKAQPDSGYIVDSLGWVLFRLGRPEEALVQMERAVSLMPVDPVVNDHLGDVYWAVGRRLEAKFQWRRALSFEPETEKDAARIRRKLEVGLDVVLQEEGVAPQSVSQNGG